MNWEPTVCQKLRNGYVPRIKNAMCIGEFKPTVCQGKEVYHVQRTIWPQEEKSMKPSVWFQSSGSRGEDEGGWMNIINVIWEEKRVMGLPGEGRTGYVTKTPFFRVLFICGKLRYLGLKFLLRPHTKGSIVDLWSYEEWQEASGGGPSGRLLGYWGCVFAEASRSPALALFLLCFPDIHTWRPVITQGDTTGHRGLKSLKWWAQINLSSFKVALFTYFFLSVLLHVIYVCDGNCTWLCVWSPEVALSGFYMSVRVLNLGPHASVASMLMATLFPQPCSSQRLITSGILS